MENVKKMFNNDTILLLYKCGSHAFGTSNKKSDEDYIVVLKDFKGLTHFGIDKKEYFIFGFEAWKDKHNFSDYYDSYFEIFNDEVLAFPDSIIYQDESIKDLTQSLKAEFKNKYKIWIKKVIEYFEGYLKLGTINKSMYHLIRIKHIIENYEKFGSFSLDLSKEVIEWYICLLIVLSLIILSKYLMTFLIQILYLSLNSFLNLSTSSFMLSSW